MAFDLMNEYSGYDIDPTEDRGAGISRADRNSMDLGQTVADFIGIQHSPESFVEILDETPMTSRNMTLSAIPNSTRRQFYEEVNRLRTFTESWDNNYHAHPVILARNGFIYQGPGDRVKCVFCSNELWNWEAGDSVEGEHRRYYPNCPFVRGQCEDLNVPVSSGLENMTKSDRLHVKTSEESSSMSSVFSGRLQSFGRGQTHPFIKPEAFANAGFFYVERDNCVECFSCHIKVSNWMPDVDPWIQHARYSPKCPYVLSIKGRQFVSQVNKSTSTEDNLRLNNDPIKTNASVENEGIVSDWKSNQDSVNNTGQTRQLLQAQGPRKLIDDDLKIPAVLAVMQTFDISVEEMTRQLEQLRLNKGPGYTVTSKDFQDLLR